MFLLREKGMILDKVLEKWRRARIYWALNELRRIKVVLRKYAFMEMGVTHTTITLVPEHILKLKHKRNILQRKVEELKRGGEWKCGKK